ncbi:MAG: hypothetical protein ACRDK2_11695 [Solirubrobacteraceae bacterium]
MRAASKHRRFVWAGTLVCLVMAGAVSAIALGDTGNTGTSGTTGNYVQVQVVPAETAAAFPLLEKQADAEETQQLPLVANAILALERSPGGAGGANPTLARAYYQTGANAGYLVPGTGDNLCTVQIYNGQLSQAGCGSASAISTKGILSTTVVPGGYEVSGLLPRGTKAVNLTGADGHTTSVEVNADGGFDLVGTGTLTRIAYKLPSGGEEVDSTRFPPPPPSEH